MKSLTLNLEKKLLILDYESKEKLDKAWDYCKAFGMAKAIINEMLCEPILNGTFLTEEEYRSLIADEDGGISISKHPLAYKISYSRHKNAFKDLIEKEGFYWLENPLADEDGTDGEGYVEDEIIHKEWKEAKSRTLKFPIIFEILEE